jgi:hypothetical protein
MTILKTKDFLESTTVRQAAGDRQEKDVAFYLRRAFKDDPNILVLNDYRFTHNGEAAQIDHLIVHRAGFIVIESKSIYGEVKVNAQGEWSRSYKGQWSGMPSPIRQAELQMELLRDFLGANVEHFLGKMLLGRVQQKVRFREWNVLCTVSSSCILHRKGMPLALSKKVVKSEFIADEVQKIGGYSRLSSTFSGKPVFSPEEMDSIGTFLLSHYQPRMEPGPETEIRVSAPVQAPEPITPTEVVVQIEPVATSALLEEAPATYSAVVETDIIGLACKKCGSEQNLTAMYGQYGYYVRCGQCGTNTSMKTACPECSSTKTRVRKRGNEYWLQCECSALRKLYQQE